MKPKAHGYIFPRKDGSKVNCGGPKFCLQCEDELKIAYIVSERMGICKDNHKFRVKHVGKHSKVCLACWDLIAQQVLKYD